MHSAPAVKYPVGRSRFQGCLVATLLGVGWLAGLCWWLAVDTAGWRQGLFFATLVLASGRSILTWLQSPNEMLGWDGEAWRCAGAHGQTSGHVQLHLDLQLCMLLCFRADSGGQQWLWPEQRTAPSAWLALRRAVISSTGDRATKLNADVSALLKP